MFTAFVAGAPAENDDCPSHVSWTRDSANSLLRAEPSYIHSSHTLFSASERAALASAAAEPHVVYAPPESSSRRNVRDSAPAFTHHVVDRGEVLDSDDVVHPSRSRLWRLAGPRIEGCVLPRVRRAFDCPDCHVCSASVRRYKPGERVDLAAHRDTRWRAVLAVELQAAAPAAAGESGLFIEEESGRRFPPLAEGDALLHGFELAHGVRVRCDGGDAAAQTQPGCVRYELVVWFHDDPAACRAGRPAAAAEALLRERSAAGVAEAQYEYAQQLLARGGAISGAKEKAQDLLLRAAAADHAGACLRLGELLHALHDEAAAQSMHDEGDGYVIDEDGFLSVGRQWLERAAELGHPRAPTALGTLLRDHGHGSAADMPRAEALLRGAAELGDVEAQSQLGRLLLQSHPDPEGLRESRHGVDALDPHAAEAWTWLRKAADAGDAPARGLFMDRRGDGLKEEL
jgi:TPR repeat protein